MHSCFKLLLFFFDFTVCFPSLCNLVVNDKLKYLKILLHFHASFTFSSLLWTNDDSTSNFKILLFYWSGKAKHFCKFGEFRCKMRLLAIFVPTHILIQLQKATTNMSGDCKNLPFFFPTVFFKKLLLVFKAWWSLSESQKGISSFFFIFCLLFLAQKL